MIEVLSELPKVLIKSCETVLRRKRELVEPLLKALLHLIELLEHLIPEFLKELIALDLHHPVIFCIEVSIQGLQYVGRFLLQQGPENALVRLSEVIRLS